MLYPLLTVLLTLFVADVADGVNCTTLNDGVYEKSCRSFTVCHGGKAEVKFCDNGLVFNAKTVSCDSPSAVEPPCGRSRDCTGKDDGVYVDDGCRSYYTCMGEVFFGHDLCPESLVFNQELKTCDWPNHVAPPCGSKH
ncbi:protein obstructor-E-like [Haliotis cracherodii]|uniref:protein obstructor-E-like n=1 Tax=Haliotis cracherodii TaxID=6455 RepID=UPI0039EB1102